MRKLPSRTPIVISLAIAIGSSAWPSDARSDRLTNGTIRSAQIRIAPEISGRLARVMATRDQAVQAGQPLALLSNPELWAAVNEARAQVAKVTSDRDRVYAGVREEQVNSLQREILKAEALQVLARQNLTRKATLAARSDAPLQELDEARAEAAYTEADVAVAKALFAEAQLGPTAEERALADAMVRASEAARNVIEARAAKMLLRAPVAGTVGSQVPEIGEAIVPGEPVLTFTPTNSHWFAFNLREDELGSLSIGARVSVTRSSGKGVEGKVTELRSWGEFAVWRSARASGDHDMNMFFVRVDPAQSEGNLEDGKTIWLTRGP
jgi:HlyD family secretion protein